MARNQESPVPQSKGINRLPLDLLLDSADLLFFPTFGYLSSRERANEMIAPEAGSFWTICGTTFPRPQNCRCGSQPKRISLSHANRSEEEKQKTVEEGQTNKNTENVKSWQKIAPNKVKRCKGYTTVEEKHIQNSKKKLVF